MFSHRTVHLLKCAHFSHLRILPLPRHVRRRTPRRGIPNASPWHEPRDCCGSCRHMRLTSQCMLHDRCHCMACCTTGVSDAGNTRHANRRGDVVHMLGEACVQRGGLVYRQRHRGENSPRGGGGGGRSVAAGHLCAVSAIYCRNIRQVEVKFRVAACIMMSLLGPAHHYHHPTASCQLPLS